MSDVDALDPTTPVVFGVGQASERLDDNDYQGLSEADLAAEAVRKALSDSGVDPDRVAESVDTVGSIRSFEISSPLSSSPFGRPDVMPAAVAQRVGITARRLIAEAVGGQSPQHLLVELAEEIAAGRSEAFVIAGAEVISTKRHITDGDGPRPDWSEHHDVAVEDRGFGIAASSPPRRRGTVCASRCCSTRCSRTHVGPGRASPGATTRDRWASCSRRSRRSPRRTRTPRRRREDRRRDRRARRVEPPDHRPVHTLDDRAGPGEPGRRSGRDVGGPGA